MSVFSASSYWGIVKAVTLVESNKSVVAHVNFILLCMLKESEKVYRERARERQKVRKLSAKEFQ
jgi:hypothetical protein